MHLGSSDPRDRWVAANRSISGSPVSVRKGNAQPRLPGRSADENIDNKGHPSRLGSQTVSRADDSIVCTSVTLGLVPGMATLFWTRGGVRGVRTSSFHLQSSGCCLFLFANLIAAVALLQTVASLLSAGPPSPALVLHATLLCTCALVERHAGARPDAVLLFCIQCPLLVRLGAAHARN